MASHRRSPPLGETSRVTRPADAVAAPQTSQAPEQKPALGRHMLSSSRTLLTTQSLWMLSAPSSDVEVLQAKTSSSVRREVQRSPIRGYVRMDVIRRAIHHGSEVLDIRPEIERRLARCRPQIRAERAGPVREEEHFEAVESN